MIITILSSNKFGKKYIKDIERYRKKYIERNIKKIINVKNWEGTKNILNMQIEFKERISEKYQRNIEKLLKLWIIYIWN